MTGEKRHAFVEDSEFSGCGADSGIKVAVRCGLPPDAEVHREAPMRRETDCPHEAWEEIGGGRKCADCREWLPPLPSTEKPAEARDERDLGEKCRSCGRRYLTVWWAVPDDFWPKVTGTEGGLLCPQCFDEKARAVGFSPYWTVADGGFPVASPPPQAQPEETDDSDVELDSPNFVPPQLESLRARGFKRINNPLAQPEGEPKRIGGMSEEEWLVALSTGRFDLRQAGDLITAAFGERA